MIECITTKVSGILFALFLSIGGVTAQYLNFAEVRPFSQVVANVEAVQDGSTAFADIDGDGDQDLVITGQDIFNQQITELYTSDGNGSYTLVTGTPFDGVVNGSVAFADIDGDNDQDILITGRNGISQRIAKLYTNDGNGNFTFVGGMPFEGVMYSSVAFADVDGDNDQDVLITGENGYAERIAKLYINDGTGNYTLFVGGGGITISFEGVSNGSVVFADVNNDNYPDVLIAGEDSNWQSTTNLYVNDGYGNFALSNVSFEGVKNGSIAFADIDGDGDLDVLITGEDSTFQGMPKLYENDGNGNFTLVAGVPFDDVVYSSVAFADIDSDNDQDVLITGRNSANQRVAKLYTNDGSGNYTVVTGVIFEGVEKGTVNFVDIDSDNDQDVLITGLGMVARISKFYVNDGNGNYTCLRDGFFNGVYKSFVAFSDVNGDGSQDVLITGVDDFNSRTTELYTNDGSGNYTLLGNQFEGVEEGGVAFADVDGDNDQDVLITGLDSSNQKVAKLYTNDGNGNFTEVVGAVFTGVSEGKVVFDDVDGDNDMDVFIAGIDNVNRLVVRLYSNDGNGNFTLVTGTSFGPLHYSSVDFADVDGDNDLDILIHGEVGFGQRKANLYTNDGNGNFTLVTGAGLEEGCRGAVAFADIDNDGDQDVLITGMGAGTSTQRVAKLYVNDGSGNFTLVAGTTFEGVIYGSVTFADIDSDNDQDVLITGDNGNGQIIAKLYINDGYGNYTLVTGTPFEEVVFSSVAFVDMENDGDQDVLITGWGTYGRVAKLYRTSVCNSTSFGIDTQVACGSYTWIDGNTYTTDNNTATYTLINSIGCDSVVTLDLTINTVDVTTTIAGNDIIANQTGATYQWVDCNNGYQPISGEINSTYTANDGNNYAVIISVGACTDTSACVNINSVGFEKVDSEHSLTLFPNPTTENIILNVKDNKGLSYQLCDTKGVVIKSEKINDTSVSIDMVNLESAVYFVKVIKNNKVVKTLKIVKN